MVRSTTTGIPTGRPACWGSYSAVRYNDGTSGKANVLRGLHGHQGLSCGLTCNPDFNVAQIGVVTRWTPVKNLTFSAEVGAFFLDQKFTGTARLARRGSEADRPSTSSRTRALFT